jgi:hypothetical protein
MDRRRRWGLTAARRRHWQPASLVPLSHAGSSGDAGAAPPDPGYGGEGAGDGCAGTMPTPGCQGGGAGRSSGAGPCIASRPDPVAGINWDTVRAPAADAGRRRARAARHLAGIPGRRPMPAAQPTKSPGTPPGDDDLNAAAAHPGRPQTARAARRAAPSARRPGPPGTGPRRAPVRERQVLPPARQHHGHRSPDVAGPLRRRCPGLPAARRLTGPERQVVPSRHRRRSRSPFSCR